MCHVDTNSTFCSINECAMFQRSTFMICGRPFPFNISSFMHSSSFSSHIFHLMATKSCKYYVQKPKASSSAYPFTMLPSGLALFLTNPFRVFK